MEPSREATSLESVLPERRAGAGHAIGRDLFTLAERLDDALVVTRGADPVYANPAARTLAEKSQGRSDAPGAALARLFPDAAWWACDQIGSWRGETALPGSDGGLLYLQLTMLCLGAADEDVPARCLILHDDSEARRYEDTLQERHSELQNAYIRLAGTQEQLLQSEKMASIGQLAAGVAHEINNPIGYVHSNLHALNDYVRSLFALIGSYEELLAGLGPDSGAPERMAELRRRFDYDYLVSDIPSLIAESREGIERVTRIVQDLKDFSRTGRDEEWTAVDLHKGLESTLNIVWNELKYKARVDRHFGQLPPVECLPSEINQVFMNLLVNAAQAIPQYGHIELSSGCDEHEAWVAISDDGAGIDPQVQQRIFDPFFTTKPVGKGSGLGLSISYGIVSKHHGRIEVQSSPGQGSTFKVVLPLRQPVRAPVS